MILHPLAMLAEERHLRGLGVRDAFERTTIERAALVISPFQQAANRLREIARGDARHGSCGLGVGETMSDWLDHGAEMLSAGDLSQPALAASKLERIRELKMAQLSDLLPGLRALPEAQAELKVLFDPRLAAVTAEIYAHFASLARLVDETELGRLLRQPGATLFEGAQGVLLDEWWGFYPYNSWSTLNYRNADTLLAENGFAGPTLKLGLLRGYATRHGAGPFVSEDPALTAALPDSHNTDNPWQRAFRVGHLDLLALRYALQVAGPIDGLAVSCLDRMQALPEWRVCDAYDYPGDPAELDGSFAHRGARVSAIRLPADPTDLVQQARLTQRLMAMRPLTTVWPRDRQAYLETLESALGLPILATSDGPTALQKEFRLPALASPIV